MPATPRNQSAAQKKMDHDVRLKTIEEHQRLRDEHIDKKFEAVGSEIQGLDKRFTAQIGGVESKLDMGFDRVFREISRERERDLDVEQSKKNEPATVRVSLLLSMAGVIFPIVTMAGILVVQTISPLKEDLHEHKNSRSHDNDFAAQLALHNVRISENRTHSDQEIARNDAESARRHTDQQKAIDRLVARQDELFLERVRMAKAEGKLIAHDEWLRDDADSIKEDLLIHAAKQSTDIDRMEERILQLQPLVGQVKQMRTQLERVDEGGSRALNLKPAETLRQRANGYDEEDN